MAGDSSAAADDATTIRQLANTPNRGMWIINAWLDIACPANSCYAESLGRFYHWRSVGKVITSSMDSRGLGEMADTATY
jgi:hypothetical protein